MSGVGGVVDGVAAGAAARDEVEHGAGTVVAEDDGAHAGDQESRLGDGQGEDAAEVRERLDAEDVSGSVGHDGEENGDKAPPSDLLAWVRVTLRARLLQRVRVALRV